MICSTPAFVLKTYDFRETSKIAVFYSRDFGKVKGVLKGIRTDRKKFGSSLPVLSLNHIIFYRKRFSDIHLVSACDLLDDFMLSRGDLAAFGYASYIAELVDVLMEVEDEHRPVFELMFDFLNTLKTRPSEDLRLAFQIKALSLSGFKPHLDSCLICDKKLTGDAYFGHRRGGLLCARCLGVERQAEPILPGSIATILYMERSPWGDCLRLKMHARVRRQLEAVMASFIRFHVGKQLKADAWVHEVLDQRA